MPTKNNLGSDCTGLAFELSGVKLDSAEGLAPVRRLAALLRANGPMRQAEATKRGEEVGISARTLRRASEKLKVDRRKLSFSEGWEWSLPTEAAEGAQGAPRPHVGGLGRLGLLPSPGAPSADEELATGDYEVF